jgi:hypothetical protein
MRWSYIQICNCRIWNAKDPHTVLDKVCQIYHDLRAFLVTDCTLKCILVPSIVIASRWLCAQHICAEGYSPNFLS